MNAHEVIRKPVITEKSAKLEEQKVYTFWINPKATKIDVKMAVKTIYGADVATVRMIKIAEKVRVLRKGSYNKRKESLKAYVTLRDKAKLDLNKFEKADKTSKVTLAPTKKAAKKSTEKTEKKATKKAAPKKK